LTPVNEDQGVHAPLCDEPRGDHRLAKRGRRGEHTGVVRQHRVGRGLLFNSQLTVKRRVDWATCPDARRESS
jgi:hypothetical protein